ncbi:GlxA family transcriptional regulator [Granulosicoccus sp.]|jgi:transcriptional regulator GlxA family with amidase domain|nr:GlxA family transcriptional regulator [Granulosicoccus sp.]MDB4223746.1 GlxA family transcriptional regulator [Granulosicoccus sp.]
MRTVLFVVYPGVKLLDLAGPLQAFTDVLDKNGLAAYQPVVASLDGRAISSDTVVTLNCESLSDWKQDKIDTLIVVGGTGVYAAVHDRDLCVAIGQLAANSRRVSSVCSGAFLLAACGLLDGFRATTHWESCHRLAAEYPAVRVEANPIFIRDKNIWTSAGVTAGLDMAFAMISEDLGRATALSLARSLVTYLVRPGGQSQFSETLELQTSDSGARFDELHHWIHANLKRNLRIPELAERVNMSSRHFSRLYTDETGRTPAKAIERIRVEAARRLLEDGNLTIASIARRCGFGDGERMRRSFVRILKVPPQRYLDSVGR